MQKIRLIPILLLRNNRMVKGKIFDNYKDVGDPVFAARVYNSQYVDELIFVDIDATIENREPNIEVLNKVSKECFMPLTVGGGVSKIEHIRKLLLNGADKVLINTKAIESPEFVEEAAEMFGRQCIVIGIDVRKENAEYIVYSKSGKQKEDVRLAEHIKNMEIVGAGEIFINSIDHDGMMIGYDIELINYVASLTTLPVIACGGAGNLMHLVEAAKSSKASALAMASIYHFGDNNPIRARSYLKNNGVAIKNV